MLSIRYLYKGLWILWYRVMCQVSTLCLKIQLCGNGVDFCRDVRAIGGIPQIRVSISAGRVFIGNHVRLNSYNDAGWYAGSSIWVRPGATLHIGDNSGLNGAFVYASMSVYIGNNVRVGGGARIMDTDFHPIDYIARRKGLEGTQSAPVRIEDDVLIGAGAIILKGVTIGEHSVIGAGSVVTKSIPANEIWGGNPAHFIRLNSRFEENTAM